MGNAAEFIANQFEVTREEMDQFAVESHHKAAAATDQGKFKAEIAPVVIKDKGHEVVIDQDEPIRRDTSLETLASLKPAFEKEGRVTAGNAPGFPFLRQFLDGPLRLSPDSGGLRRLSLPPPAGADQLRILDFLRHPPAKGISTARARRTSTSETPAVIAR